MGRRRLPMELIENEKTRRATFLNRIKGMKKKASELGTLCGIDVAVVCFGPDNDQLETWPENSPDLRRVIDRYTGTKKDESKKYAHDRWTKRPRRRSEKEQGWLDALPPESLRTLAGDLASKLARVAERIDSLRSSILQPINIDCPLPISYAYPTAAPDRVGYFSPAEGYYNATPASSDQSGLQLSDVLSESNVGGMAFVNEELCSYFGLDCMSLPLGPPPAAHEAAHHSPGEGYGNDLYGRYAAPGSGDQSGLQLSDVLSESNVGGMAFVNEELCSYFGLDCMSLPLGPPPAAHEAAHHSPGEGYGNDLYGRYAAPGSGDQSGLQLSDVLSESNVGGMAFVNEELCSYFGLDCMSLPLGPPPAAHEAAHHSPGEGYGNDLYGRYAAPGSGDQSGQQVWDVPPETTEFSDELLQVLAGDCR